MSRTDDPDNPEWTEEMFRKARPAREVFPDLKFSRPKRGPQKAPTKVQTTIRLDRHVVDHFRAGGPGWQRRVNEALKEVVAKAERKAG